MKLMRFEMTPCKLFEYIAQNVWEEILENHPFNNRLNEDGLTRQAVVGRIQRYVRNNNSFSVFAQTIGDERNQGADLEVYIQTGYNSFFRLLLQAKLSEPAGYFGNLKKKSGNTVRYQFDTLIGFGNSIKSPTYYILYQGIPNSKGTYSDCKGEHNEKQFGCAIMRAQSIKEYCETNNTSRLDASKPQGDPWRKLTCCEDIFNQENFKTYTKEQIDMDPSFSKLFTPSEPSESIDYGEYRRQKSSTQIENELLHAKGWNPSSRIIMTNKPMYKSGNILQIRD